MKCWRLNYNNIKNHMSTKFTNNVYLDTQEGNKTPIKKG